MTKRSTALKSIASTIADYREGEIPEPTPQHVDQWISQFSKEMQEPLLVEVDHVLKQTYFEKAWVLDCFNDRVKNEKITGEKPRAFWRSANFLRIQQDGHSQEELLALFGESLKAQLGVEIDICGKEGGPFIYLDDALFSGNRIGNDISTWIKEAAPATAVVNIMVFAVHTLGEWQMMNRIKKEAAAAGKKIDFHLWRAVTFENRKRDRDTSEVLWPATLPVDISLDAYIEQEKKFPFEPRKPGKKLKYEIFSSEEGRQLLESEFLLAGIRIRGLCKNPKKVMRPLGFSKFGLGFGSMIVTFRNCPNNCPLALWWGDATASPSSPLGQWYPLLSRKTYGRDTEFYGDLF
ncbi:MAG: hypothetical protein KJ936_08395 [Proteobacteria bacterium]|nr:hypothetical protein [Pseudomonadota bacterium]MBU2227670.1 hypothetical protein [Pseudomonadota bacterium]